MINFELTVWPEKIKKTGVYPSLYNTIHTVGAKVDWLRRWDWDQKVPGSNLTGPWLNVLGKDTSAIFLVHPGQFGYQISDSERIGQILVFKRLYRQLTLYASQEVEMVLE